MTYTLASDSLASFTASTDSPARAAAVITPSDSADLSPYAKALKCNADGDIYVLPVGNYAAGNTTPVRLSVNAGEYVPVQVARIFATGTTLTTAGDIVALYQ